MTINSIDRHIILVSIIFITLILISDYAYSDQLSGTITSKITIRTDASIGNVNRYILGSNIKGYYKDDKKGVYNNKASGVWNPVLHRPVQIFVDAVKNAGIKSLRWNQVGVMDWHRGVGDIKTRKTQMFGLHEFLTFCEAVGAIPVITISALKDTPDGSADLVEYLNSPLNGKNPNGEIDWAMKRKQDGRSEPWNVKWFEYGNETFNELKDSTSYAEEYIKIQEAMKLVDPEISLGAIFDDSINIEGGWSYNVMGRIGNNLDYAVTHIYLPNIKQNGANYFSKEKIARATLASDSDIQYRLSKYNEMIALVSGRDDIKLAVTEFNGGFVQESPVPYRHTLLNAIHNAEQIRLFLDPRNKILFANHWLLANEYWGMLVGGLDGHSGLVKQANYLVFEIYNRYLGDEALDVNIVAPRVVYEGGLGVSPRVGKFRDGAWERLSNTPFEWDLSWGAPVDQKQVNGKLEVKFSGDKDVDYYHATKMFDVEPNTGYRLQMKLKATKLKNGVVGLILEDARGWSKTYYQSKNMADLGTTDWEKVSVEMQTSLDTSKLRVAVRRFRGDGHISGLVEVKDVVLFKNKRSFGAYPVISSIITKDFDNNNLYIIVLNKSLNAKNDITITLAGNTDKYKVFSAELMSGKSPFSSNMKATEPQEVTITPLVVEWNSKKELTLSMPPTSMIGIKLEKISTLVN